MHLEFILVAEHIYFANLCAKNSAIQVLICNFTIFLKMCPFQIRWIFFSYLKGLMPFLIVDTLIQFVLSFFYCFLFILLKVLPWIFEQKIFAIKSNDVPLQMLSIWVMPTIKPLFSIQLCHIYFFHKSGCMQIL